MSESGPVAVAQQESHAVEPPQADVQQAQVGDERDLRGADPRPARRLKDVLRRALGSGRVEPPADLWPRVILSMPDLAFGARRQPRASTPASHRSATPDAPVTEPAPPRRPSGRGRGGTHSPPPTERGVVPGPPPRLRGSGHPVDARVRARVEQATGEDLLGVRVHTDSSANTLAAELHARAFTIGQDIYFAAGEYSPGTQSGESLLAHELAHVVQGGDADVTSPFLPVSDPEDAAEREARRFASELAARGPRAAARTRLGETRRAVIHRDSPKPDAKADEEKILKDLFGDEGLASLKKEIASNPDAKKLTTERGAVAYLALADTRENGKLAPAKARAALDADAKKSAETRSYELALMRLRPDAAKRLWFHEKDPTQRDEEMTAARESEEVMAEKAPMSSPGGNMEKYDVATANFRDKKKTKIGDVPVRFAYQKREFRGDKLSEDVKNSKTAVLAALSRVLGDMAVTTTDKAATPEMKITAAHMRDSLKKYTQEHPLNIYLGETTVTEMLSGGRLPETDRIYIDENDIGDEKKLESAIRLPLTAMLGGVVGMADVPALTPGGMDEAVLHESIHAELIRQGASANQVWEQVAATVKIEAPPTLHSRAVELIRRMLLAQEEAFVYREVAQFGGKYLIKEHKDKGEEFGMKAVLTRAYLMTKGATMTNVTKPLAPPKGKGKAAKSDWSITYDYPSALKLEPTDLTKVNDVIAGKFQ